MKKAPKTPKEKKSLLKKDVRLKRTRKQVADLADEIMKSGRVTRMQALKEAIKELQMDEMLIEEYMSKPDYPSGG